jgi:hypothetical protein
MNTLEKTKMYKFEVGDKCIFCQTPMLDYSMTRNPEPVGDSTKGRCCSDCDKRVVLFSRMRIIQGVPYITILEALHSCGMPKYKSE